MGVFKWDDKYVVDGATMDHHHQKLFDIINILFDAMKDGQGDKIIKSTLDELLQYTKFHFHEEEVLLERINYPGLATQKTQHKAFIEKVEEYKKEVDAGKGVFICVQVATTTSNWLKTHILKEDKQYAEYIAKNKITI